jgi:pheromone shutdown protein TraB
LLANYAAIAGRHIKASLFDIVLQAVVQGILTAIIALLRYGRTVSLLRATAGAAFVALTPTMPALLAVLAR